MNITSENTFETAIIESLLQTGGYSPEPGMFKAEVLHFLRDSQPKQWDKRAAIHGDMVTMQKIVLSSACIKRRICVAHWTWIRNGIVDYGVRFKMALFKPESGLSQNTLALYEQSQMKVIRQVYFNPTTQMTARTQSQLYSFIDPAVDRYKAIETGDEKEEFKKAYVPGQICMHSLPRLCLSVNLSLKSFTLTPSYC